MRIDEIINDPEFNKMMKNIIREPLPPKPGKDDYPFVLLHPKNDSIGIILTDVDDIEKFDYLWRDASEEARAEFGYDLPCICDKDQNPIQHNNKYIEKNTGINRYISMTFDQYVELCISAYRGEE